jgi:hypothetical protein
VRGYDVGTFESADCTPTAASDCPQFDRLIGSRLLVGNLEFRFPLLRPFGASQRMDGPVPVEVALFADGGVTWNRSQRPSFLGGSRGGVGSAGVALCVNLFGTLLTSSTSRTPSSARAEGGFSSSISRRGSKSLVGNIDRLGRVGTGRLARPTCPT